MYLLRLLIGGALLILAGGDSLPAQGLLSKQIHIIVPNPPGAATDFFGRIAARWIGERTGLPVVIENRAGAGGNIALETVANAEPNGQTLLVATNGAITINRALFKKDPIDTLSDIVPVALLGLNPNLLAVNAKLPAQTAQQFIALARSQPGKINYGSAGVGSTPHLSVALFARFAGINLVHVPYRGMAPAVTDLLAGNIQAVAIAYGTVAPFVEAGTLRILAASTHRRLSYLPEVPTADEAGVPAWELETWYGLFVPHDTPRAIVTAFNGHIATMLDDPATKKLLADNFYDTKKMSADEFAALVKAEAAKWERVVKETGIEAQ